jgi:uncharacterized membrane-anchored protein YjiN (DUF445 family)
MSVLVSLTRVSLIPARAAYRSMANAGGRAAGAGLDVVLASPYMRQAVDHVLARLLSEHRLERMLDRPELERILKQLLESPGAERLVTQVIESRLVEDAVTQVVDRTATRLPQSQAVWTLIDEVAQSPAVTDAISQQGKGMADQFAGEVRQRADTVDDRLERAARRLLHRRRPTDAAVAEAAT